jgi:hypothetical protein
MAWLGYDSRRGRWETLFGVEMALEIKHDPLKCMNTAIESLTEICTSSIDTREQTGKGRHIGVSWLQK